MGKCERVLIASLFNSNYNSFHFYPSTKYEKLITYAHDLITHNGLLFTSVTYESTMDINRSFQ